MKKKCTNSGPYMESTGKHRIYPPASTSDQAIAPAVGVVARERH
jgi:hypothetical protein